ncbi:hypothetical protein [Flagellimonas allohymeniacidonis]|uniref:DUF3244 domain-containing protein n=1 Tax=Flagellimonas allohymeniacidonis TaxID=2517819 RepID=A0A4V2HS75_9FLAO|nr:hypothetical protein [Allomuricauda hymeniacidonis]TAI46610.1 hypothetical protein EW142_16150 [Allomuricauda hymeniacidonis]
MKSVLKTITVAAVLFAGAVGFANGPAKSEVEKKLVTVELDPVFVKKGDTLLINLLNLSQENVTLKVYDSEGRLVFSEKIEGEVVVEKAFNFEKAYEDEYTVIVADASGTYKEKVSVR